jgi:hypothetical protein
MVLENLKKNLSWGWNALTKSGKDLYDWLWNTRHKVHTLVNEPIQRFSSTLRYAFPFFPKSHLIDHVQAATQAQCMHDALIQARQKLLAAPSSLGRTTPSKRLFSRAFDSYLQSIEQTTARHDTSDAYLRMIATLIQGIKRDHSVTAPSSQWASHGADQWSDVSPSWVVFTPKLLERHWTSPWYTPALSKHLLWVLEPLHLLLPSLQKEYSPSREAQFYSLMKTVEDSMVSTREGFLHSANQCLETLVERTETQKSLSLLYKKMHREYMHKRPIDQMMDTIKHHMIALSEREKTATNAWKTLTQSIGAFTDLGKNNASTVDKYFTQRMESLHAERDTISQQSAIYRETVYATLEQEWNWLRQAISSLAWWSFETLVHKDSTKTLMSYVLLPSIQREEIFRGLRFPYRSFHASLPVLDLMVEGFDAHLFFSKNLVHQYRVIDLYLTIFNRFFERYHAVLMQNTQQLTALRRIGIAGIANMQRSVDREVHRIESVLWEIKSLRATMETLQTSLRSHVRLLPLLRDRFHKLFTYTAHSHTSVLASTYTDWYAKHSRILGKDYIFVEKLLSTYSQHLHMLEVKLNDIQTSLRVAPSKDLQANYDSLVTNRECLQGSYDMLLVYKKQLKTLISDSKTVLVTHTNQRKLLKQALTKTKQAYITADKVCWSKKKQFFSAIIPDCFTSLNPDNLL